MASTHPWVLLAGVGAGRGTLSRGARHPSPLWVWCVLSFYTDLLMIFGLQRPNQEKLCAIQLLSLNPKENPLSSFPSLEGKGDPSLHGVCYFSQF